LGLIQFSADNGNGATVWVIDCFAGLNLTPLQGVLINTTICKVIHYAEFDIAMLKKSFNWQINNVWCTLTAEKRAGRRGLKLKELVLRYFDIDMDKAHQTDDWSVRPLSKEQIYYAGLDAEILLRLYRKQLEHRLDGKYEGRESERKSNRVDTIDFQPLPVKPKERGSWNQEMSDLITWFNSAKLPSKPFVLRDGHTIIDPDKWYGAMKVFIDDGPRGPRARTEALRGDLMALQAAFGEQENSNEGN
jgi:ribonuclease D